MTLPDAIKTLLPMRFKQNVRAAFERFQLSRQERLSFDASKLCPASAIDLASILTDTDINQAYELDLSRFAGKFPRGEIYAGTNPGDRKAIYHLIASFRPEQVLEIGTHVGASTISIAAALRRRSGEKAHLTTVDISDVNAPDAAWARIGLSSSPSGFLEDLDLRNMVTFVNKPAREALAVGDKTYDLIFLDGDHSAPAVYNEIAYALERLNPSGLILLHDFYPNGQPLVAGGNAIPGPAMAAGRISRETAELNFIPLGNLPWETKQGNSATSLALVAGNRRT